MGKHTDWKAYRYPEIYTYIYKRTKLVTLYIIRSAWQRERERERDAEKERCENNWRRKAEKPWLWL